MSIKKSSLPMWQSEWDKAESEWDERAKKAAHSFPLKNLKSLPQMPGITTETAKNLKWKSLKWMILKDTKRDVLRGFLKHPFKYGWRFICSIGKKKSFKREGDLFFYGLHSIDEFEKSLQKAHSILVLGFSYCHKPFECPSGRFTSECIHDEKNAVCQQCFIGKAIHAAPIQHTYCLIIPTIHYIGAKIFEIVHAHPFASVVFMITACELTLQMFGDWGNMVDIKGIGIRLDGRICNTMQAFELSERGIKPGLTVVLPDTQRILLDLLKKRHYFLEKSAFSLK